MLTKIHTYKKEDFSDSQIELVFLEGSKLGYIRYAYGLWLLYIL